METIPLQGLLVARLAASTALLALAPDLAIMGGLMPEEARLGVGQALVLVEDGERSPDWLTETCRIEYHRPKITVHATAALPPTDPQAPAPRTPAEAIMDVVEGLVHEALDLLGTNPAVTLYVVLREDRSRRTLPRRDPSIESRVQELTASWRVEFEYNF